MGYNCDRHGWSHLFEMCPQCFNEQNIITTVTGTEINQSNGKLILDDVYFITESGPMPWRLQIAAMMYAASPHMGELSRISLAREALSIADILIEEYKK